MSCYMSDLVTGEFVASAGAMNPQIRFGEDLMSRVSYVMMNPGGDKEMTQAVRDGLNRLFEEVCAEAGIETGDDLNANIDANPTMHHPPLRHDPTEHDGTP